MQALDFAFAVRRGAGDLAGEVTIDFLGFGGDEIRNAELRGDGLGDEAVGGGDDQQGVALPAVFFHQGARRRCDQG